MPEQGKISKLENSFTQSKEKELRRGRLLSTLTRKREKRALIIIGLFILCAGVFITQIIHAHTNLRAVNTQIVKQHQELHKAQLDSRQLNYQVKQLNNTNYVEQLIRSKYYYTKPGELVYSFPNSAPKDVQDSGN